MTRRQEVFDEPRGLLCRTTIDDLPDDALLEIFDSYLGKSFYTTDKWHTLVHVCQRWRSVVFASPRRLDLRLLCRGHRSVTAMLDIWPALPLHIHHGYDWNWDRSAEKRLDSMIAALAHPDRVCHINLFGIPKTWDAFAAAMRVPFPELTYLRLGTLSALLSVLPGGCAAPRLRTLELVFVPFWAVRGLLLSAGDLVNLTLYLILIPRSGHVSPESMIACLSSLKRLESLSLHLDPDTESHPDQPGPLPQARAVLPALATFSFQGMSGYLEDFVARIDTPVLDELYMSLEVNGSPVLGIPHLAQFIGRARRLKPSKAARVLFQSLYLSFIQLEFPPRDSSLLITVIGEDWGISSMVVVCGQLSPFLYLFERLDLVAEHDPPVGDRIEPALFLQLFRTFTAIEDLYVSKDLVPHVAPALQELIGERVTEVLPNLRNLFLGGSVILGPVQEAIQPFVDARWLSGQTIAIHHWEDGEAN